MKELSIDGPLAEIAIELAAALHNHTCTCVFNVPYVGGAIDRKLVFQCFRCAALEKFEQLKQART